MGDYKQILLAVDFAPESEAIGGRAVDLMRRFGAQLTLIHVVANLYEEPVYDLMSSFPADVEEQLVKHADQSLRELAKRLGVVDAECVVQMGTPKSGIIQAAKDRKVDLIVLGSHGVHGFELLLGSTANAVLHAAPCDVLAVRVGR
jgi:universal stress protein A